MTMGKRVAATSAENSLPSGTLVRKGSDRSVTTHGWLRMAKVATILLFLGWSVGQVCLDATWFTGLLFYIPSPAIFAILGTGTVLGLRGATGESSQRISITTVMALLAAGIMTFGVENQFSASAKADGQNTDPANIATIVHWNTCSGSFGQNQVRKKLLSLDADFYLLSEPLDDWPSWIKEDRHSVLWLAKMMAVAHNGDTLEKQPLVDREESQIWSVRWTHNGKTLHIFAVDLTSNLLQHRDPLLRELNQLIHEHKPDLVLGDFNAPRRSIQLQRLPKGYVHAYEVAGGEFGYTWPVPLPLYAIDQCVVGSDVDVLSYDLQTSFSDHRLQRLEIFRR